MHQYDRLKRIMFYLLVFLFFVGILNACDSLVRSQQPHCMENICGPRYEAIHGKPCPRVLICTDKDGKVTNKPY